MQNSFGQKFIVAITGSSHGEFVGGNIRNCPKGLKVDYDLITKDLDRRRPQKYGTLRNEIDNVEFLSGITNGKTDGSLIEFRVKNENVKTKDYTRFNGMFRPSHADYTYYIKFGNDSLDYKDNASARMFLPIVVAGSFAKMLLKPKGIEFNAYVTEIGGIDYLKHEKKVAKLLEEVYLNGDTLGGKVRCEIEGIPAGLGEPIFDKVSVKLAKTMMSIPSAVSFSLGDIENRDRIWGSEDIDEWNTDFLTKTNHSGGINAGITNGMPIVFTVGLHPVHTLRKDMTLVTKDGNLVTRKITGRHDVCQVLRTPVIVENLAAILIADLMM